MRQQNGWVKLHSALLSHPSVEGDIVALGIFVWLLMRANWKTSKVKHEGDLIEVKPGQLITSAVEISRSLKIPRMTCERKLTWFEKCGSIGQRVGIQGRLITITNWDTYQARGDDRGQPMGNERSSDGQPMGTYEEEKTEKKQEKKKETRKQKQGAVGSSTAPAAPTDGSLVWEAYREAYEARYRVEPIRNAKVNAQCSQLAKRLGVERAQEIVRFYLSHNGAFYTRSSHALGPCVADAEGLATQSATGLRMTSAAAREADNSQANIDVFRQVFTQMDAEGKLDKWKGV